MKFEDWLTLPPQNNILLLDHAEEIIAVVKAAWTAAHEVGYETGCEEVMNK